MMLDQQPNISFQGCTNAYVYSREWACNQPPMTLAVSCGVGGIKHVAFVDTGATWSIVGGDLVQEFSDFLAPTGDSITLNSRHGSSTGEIHNLRLTLWGQNTSDFDISVKALVLPEWPGPPLVLGLRGCLEHFKWALDPGMNAGEQPRFYFGA